MSKSAARPPLSSPSDLPAATHLRLVLHPSADRSRIGHLRHRAGRVADCSRLRIAALFHRAETLSSLCSDRFCSLGGIFCFFLHVCGGIRHLLWDAGRGFELGAIYTSGWIVVAASIVLTVSAWIVSSILAR